MRRIAYLGLLVSCLASATAFADVDDGALMETGVRLRREHRDAEALEVFRRLHSTHASPRTLAQIALAEQALGQWVEAERDLRTALNAADDAWIASHRAALTEEVDTLGQHLATLTVKANAAAGVVSLNGTRAGDLPLTSVRIPSGSVRIEVRSPGYHPAVRTIEVASGATVSEELRLTELEEAPIAVEPSSSASPPAKGAAPRLQSAPATFAGSSTSSPGEITRDAFAWGALGTAGVLLGGAIAAQIVSVARASKYNDDAQCSYGDRSRDERCGVYRGQAETAQTFATVGFVSAGAVGVGAAVLFLLNSSSKKTAGVQPWLTIGAAGGAAGVGGTL